MSDQEKLKSQTRGANIYEGKHPPSREDYSKQALENLQATSRTAKGVVDTSASADKTEKMSRDLTVETAVKRALQNFTDAIQYLYEHRQEQFNDPQKLRGFVERVAKQINAGITKEGVLIRSGMDSTKFPYTKIADLESAMQQFYQELLHRLNEPMQDPKEIAAFIEYHIDPVDHFFADGCGKAAKAISAWSLMRVNMPLPHYRGRDEYYAHARLQNPTGDPVIDKQQQWEQWLAYYKTLFEKQQ